MARGRKATQNSQKATITTDKKVTERTTKRSASTSELSDDIQMNVEEKNDVTVTKKRKITLTEVPGEQKETKQTSRGARIAAEARRAAETLAEENERDSQLNLQTQSNKHSPKKTYTITKRPNVQLEHIRKDIPSDQPPCIAQPPPQVVLPTQVG